MENLQGEIHGIPVIRVFTDVSFIHSAIVHHGWKDGRAEEMLIVNMKSMAGISTV